MHSPASSLLLIASLLKATAVGATPIVAARDGTSPALPYDPNTASYCSWWVDLTAATDCAQFVNDNYITLDDFRRWVSTYGSACMSCSC
jgi:hypothetical protein